jgi:hypothetical protein
VLDPRGALRLHFLTGPGRGTIAVLRPPRVRIGRSRDNDIVLADREGATASGHHAEAVCDGGQWWIHDLHSTNGTLLNGARVTRAPIRPGDRLRFGDAECQVRRGRFGIIVATLGVILIALTAAAVILWRQPTFEAVAASVARSSYLVAIDRDGRREIVGTAFVVGVHTLATNAHVAAGLNVAADQPARAVVVRNDTGDALPIAEVRVSPGWRQGSLAHDAAMLCVPGLPADARPLRLADAATLRSLARGMTVATFGFPASSTDPRRPRGRLAVDVIGDVRDQQYLAVGLRIAPGASGSAIFLPDGVIIGLVAGGDFVPDANGTLGPSGTNVNWGISVAPLQNLLGSCR